MRVETLLIGCRNTLSIYSRESAMIGVLVMEKKIGCPIPNCLGSRREVCILLSRETRM